VASRSELCLSSKQSFVRQSVTLYSLHFVTWAEYFSCISGALNWYCFGRIHLTTCILLPLIHAALYYGLDFNHFSFMCVCFGLYNEKYGSAVI